jgi:hypothetical protein
MKVRFTCTLDQYWGIEDFLAIGVDAQQVKEFLFEDIIAVLESQDARWEFITEPGETPIEGGE